MSPHFSFLNKLENNMIVCINYKMFIHKCYLMDCYLMVIIFVPDCCGMGLAGSWLQWRLSREAGRVCSSCTAVTNLKQLLWTHFFVEMKFSSVISNCIFMGIKFVEFICLLTWILVSSGSAEKYTPPVMPQKWMISQSVLYCLAHLPRQWQLWDLLNPGIFLNSLNGVKGNCVKWNWKFSWSCEAEISNIFFLHRYTSKK